MIISNKTKSSNLLSKYLGCTFDKFIDWIKYQFSKDMTLENYGEKWHIDHVLPCASFNFSDEAEIKKCMSWTNLRPCLKIENIKKSDKICIYSIDEHIKTLNNYIDEYSKLILKK
jgi:hypothetical protein